MVFGTKKVSRTVPVENAGQSLHTSVLPTSVNSGMLKLPTITLDLSVSLSSSGAFGSSILYLRHFRVSL